MMIPHAIFFACALYATAFTAMCLLTPLSVLSATKEGRFGGNARDD
jgi:hypothetical protein